VRVGTCRHARRLAAMGSDPERANPLIPADLYVTSDGDRVTAEILATPDVALNYFGVRHFVRSRVGAPL
jgi:hypothetical protein